MVGLSSLSRPIAHGHDDQTDRHTQEERVEGQGQELARQDGQRAADDGGQGEPAGDLSLEPQAAAHGQEDHCTTKAHGQEPEVVDHGPRDQDGHTGGDHQDDHDGGSGDQQGLAGLLDLRPPGLENVGDQNGGHAQGQTGAAADDSDEQGTQDDAAHQIGHAVHHEHGENLGGGLQTDEPFRDGLSRRRQGGHLVGGDAVAPHVQANEDTGHADGGDEEGAEQGTLLGLPVGLARPDGLGVGLGGQDTQQQGDTGADVLAHTPSHQGGVPLPNAHLVGQAVQGTQGGPLQKGPKAVHEAPQAPGQTEDQNAAQDGGGIEEDQLGHAPQTGSPHAAEDHIDRHEGDGDDGGSEMAYGSDGDEEGRGRQDLGHHADEDADGAEDAAQPFRFSAVLPGDDLQKSGAAALPVGRGEAQSQDQAADARAQGEPPGGQAVGKGQLGGADGGLAADQGAHDGAADDPGPGFAAAAGEVGRRLDLPAGVDADIYNEKDRGQKADDM